MNHPSPLEAVFFAALEKGAPRERAAYLDEACASDPELRRRVEKMLAAQARGDSFLEHPAHGSVATVKFSPVTECAGSVIGPYKLLEQIGEGGFGVVFMADQQQPVRRKVALKVLKPGMDSRQVVARFEAERQALALMEHPNIARVLDAGETVTGRPYFVMELVRGMPVTEFCDHSRLGVRDRLGLFAAVCNAVQHAHHKGVIHRDLKPTNVLVTLHDGVPVPKVIDFGIAKAVGQPLTDKTLFTGFAQLVGTPLYMSPEQAAWSGLDVDTRSDIYSLGVLLYELLTGTTPVDKERLRMVGLDEVRRIIQEEEPAKPSTRLSTLGQAGVTVSANRGSDPGGLSRLFRGELDWIVMKALEKDRNRRYETPGAFAADVRRYQVDEPVQACPPSAGYRLRKFARRNKAGVLAAAGVALGVLLAIGTALAVQAAGTARVKAEQKHTQDALDREKETTDALTRALENEARAKYYRDVALAERELAAGNVGRAEELLDGCPPRFRGWEWHHLSRRPHAPLTLRGQGSQMIGVAVSPDGRHVATSGLALLFGQVLIWDRETGRLVRRLLGFAGVVDGLAYSPDGKSLATACWDGTVKVWDPATGQERHTLRGHSEYVRSVAFSPDGKLLASAGGDRTVLLWDAESFGQVGKLSGHTGGIYGVTFGPGGRLASASSDGTVRVWDAAAGREEHVLRGHAGPVVGVAVSRDGKRIASAGFDGTVRVWDAAAGRHARTIRVDNVLLASVAFSPDGTRLAAGSLDNTVRLWDVDADQEAITLRGHDDMVMGVAFGPDGQQLVSVSMDGTAKVWDAAPAAGPGARPLRGHTGAVFGVAFRPGGGEPLLASASSDETVRMWDPATGAEVRTLTGHAGPVARVAFSRDGKRMLSADYAGVTKVWDAGTFREVRTFRSFGGAAAISPDGRRVALTDEGAWVRVCDAESGEEVRPPFRTHTAPVVGVTFSPDGSRLATAGWDGVTKVWDIAAGRVVHTLIGHGHVVTTVAFSPDGSRLATSSWDKMAKVWDAATGAELVTLRGHTHRLVMVAFHPDGTKVVTASQDNTVRVWDAATGRELHAIPGHHVGNALCAAFSPDGKRLASSSGYRGRGEVKVWDATRWDRKSDPK